MSKAAKQSIFLLISLLILSLGFAFFNVIEKQKVDKDNMALSQKIEGYRNEIDDRKKEISKLEREIENQISKANNEKDSLQRDLDRAKDKVDNLSDKLNDSENEVEKWKTRLDSARTERDDLMSSIRDYKNNVSDLESKIKKLEDKNEELVEKVKEQPEPKVVYKNAEPKIVYVDKPVASETGVKSAASSDLPAPVINITTEGTENDEYWAGVLREKMDLEMKVEALEDKMDDSKIENAELQKKNANFEAELNLLEKEKEAIAREIVEKEKQIKMQLEKKNEEMQQKERMINSLSVELARSKNENKIYQQRAKKFEDSNKDLMSDMRKLVNAKGSLEKSILELTKEKKQVERKLGQTDGIIQSKIDEIWKIKESLDNVIETANREKPRFTAPQNEVELQPIVVNSRAPESKKETSAIRSHGLEGKVVSVNETNNFIIVDLGESSGVQVGDVFNVYKGGKIIARVEIIQVRKDISAADIKNKIAQISTGDIIK